MMETKGLERHARAMCEARDRPQQCNASSSPRAIFVVCRSPMGLPPIRLAKRPLLAAPIRGRCCVLGCPLNHTRLK